MLLLNAMRVLISIIGLLIVGAFQQAYGLTGVALIGVLAIVLMAVFVASDLAEEALINHFNKDDEQPAS